MNTQPNFSSPILSRLLTLLTNEERKFILKRAKHKSCPVDLRGVRVHEKELVNPRSLLHQRVVAALERGDVTLLIPSLTPLADRRAGPLLLANDRIDVVFDPKKGVGRAKSLYEESPDETDSENLPRILLCDGEGRVFSAAEATEAWSDFFADWGRHALTALVAAAWCEATILAKNTSDDESPEKKDREFYFSAFFEGVARHPALWAQLKAQHLCPEDDDEDRGDDDAKTDLSGASGETARENEETKEEGNVRPAPKPAGNKSPSLSAAPSETTRSENQAKDDVRRVEREEKEETLPTSGALRDASLAAERSASVRKLADPAVDAAEVAPWADDGAPIPTVFDAPALSTEPAPERPAGCTRSLVYAMMTGGSFWNLYFVANLDDAGGVLALSEEELARRFPKYGAVNIRFPANSRVSLSLGQFYVFDWSDADLDVNRDIDGSPRDDYYYRVEGPKVMKEGRLFPASRLAFYPVVRPADRDAEDVFDIDFERTLTVRTGEAAAASGPRPLAGSPVLLAAGDKLFGPVTLKEDALHRPYVSFTSEVLRSGSLVAGYVLPAGKAGKKVFLEVEQFRPDSFGYVPVTVACVPNLPRKLFDVQSDEALLREACEATAKTPMEREVFSRLLTIGDAAKNPFSGDPAVADARAKRLTRLIAGFRRSDDWVENAGKLFTELFDRLSESKSARKSVDALVARLMKEPQLPRKLESYGEVAERIEKLRTEAKFVEAENARKKDDADAKLARLKRDIAEKEREIEEKKREKATIEKNLLAGVQEEVDALERRKTLLEKEVDLAGDRLREAFADAGRYAFDGAVAAKFTEAAAAWEDDQRKRNFDERAKAIAALPLCPKEGNALKRHLLESVAEYRPSYGANDVLNLFLLLTQNFLTILSGPPGAGKTSMCGILAHAMGLTTLHAQAALRDKTALWDDLREADRYLPVSVERGWTSKRDFIGYYNPLTKTFESLDARRYEAFAELNAEKRAKCESVPYLMLLDEANLSPMEYYFADFMNICDERNDLSFISLGDKMRYAIPDTLRFVATINDDFTTENLSPRLLDRAAVVILPEADPLKLSPEGPKPLDLDTARPVVSWSAMQALFGARGLDADGIKAQNALNELCTHFAMLNGHRTPVSPRTWKASLAYVSAAVKVFEKTDRPAWVVALDYACAERLLPRINGNGPRFREALEKLRRRLVEYDLTLSTKLLDNLLARGEMEMDFYRFCG